MASSGGIVFSRKQISPENVSVANSKESFHVSLNYLNCDCYISLLLPNFVPPLLNSLEMISGNTEIFQ